MPYIDGQRVSNAEWTERFGTIERLHTGPDGENPAAPPDIDPEIGAPKSERKTKNTDSAKAGGKRSQRSTKAAKAAIADAMGVKEDSPALADIDVSGLDAPAEEEAAE